MWAEATPALRTASALLRKYVRVSRPSTMATPSRASPRTSMAASVSYHSASRRALAWARAARHHASRASDAKTCPSVLARWARCGVAQPGQPAVRVVQRPWW